MNKEEDLKSQSQCFLCKSTSFLSGKMKRFYFSTLCNHKICEDCLNKCFQNKSFLICNVCKREHRSKEEYSLKSKEELFYEQDVKYRKKVLGIMNKTLEDFNKNEEEYNKFLEDIENKILNLIENKNVEKINNELEEYRKNNKNSIDVNNFRRQQEITRLENLNKSKDPQIIYNSQIQKQEKLKKEENKINIPIFQNLSVKKLPQKQDIPIHKKGDLNLERNAGGYQVDSIYNSYKSFAFYGLEY